MKRTTSTLRRHSSITTSTSKAIVVACRDAGGVEDQPNKSIQIKRMYEDGDTVITHSRVSRQDPQAPDIAVVHIFRFEHDRIAELWDLGQPISKDSPNENGMF
jgi:predicted SnoaL-like aldol condensation-catalyzing enzyme